MIGHDVFITGGGFDEVMTAKAATTSWSAPTGEDHFDGGGGFDWGSYKHDRFGVTVDMLVSDLIEPPVAPSNAGHAGPLRLRRGGLSGSAFGDILRGDDADAAEIDVAGTLKQRAHQASPSSTGCRSCSTACSAPATPFGSGNIILGGDGSDIIEGRGGDDLIDGDSGSTCASACARASIP